MNSRYHLFLALLGASLLLPACPSADDDDDSAADDDDTTGDDDDSTGDDDDSSAGDDDDSVGDDDDSSVGDDDDSAGAVEIRGLWDDGFGSTHAVTDDGWLTWGFGDPSRFDATQWDDAAGWLVAQNGADNEYNAGLWSKFEWMTAGGDLVYCQSTYDAADEATAEVASADREDLAGGCNGFGWSTLTPDAQAIAIGGLFTDQWGSDNLITNTGWWQGTSSYAISQYDNVGGWAVAQNASTNEYNPDLWSRFDYTWFEGAWYYCQSAYDAADEATALAAAAADPTDPSTGGCGGSFAWTNLTP